MLWYLWLAGTIGVIFVVGTLWLAPTSSGALRNHLIATCSTKATRPDRLPRWSGTV